MPVLHSTLLAEAVMHATERRAKPLDALETQGLTSISLGSIDVWAFESDESGTIFTS